MPFINTRQDLEDLKPALIKSIEFVQSINFKNIKNCITIRNILIFIYLNLLCYSFNTNKYILVYHFITSIIMITIIKRFQLYSGINNINSNRYVAEGRRRKKVRPYTYSYLGIFIIIIYTYIFHWEIFIRK